MPNVKILTSDEIDYDIKDEKGRLGTASEFSTSSNYVIGDYCWYDNKLYRFTANHSSSSWTAAHATEVKIATELKTVNDETAELKNEMVSLLPESNASGAVAHFIDGADDIPVKDLKIGIVPKQSGSGDPSPTNVRSITGWMGATVMRAGVNVWDEEWENGYYSRSTGAKTGDSNTGYIRSKNYIYVMPSTQYYIKIPAVHASNTTFFGVLFYDANKNYISSLQPYSVLAISTPATCAYMTFYCEIGTTGATYQHDISINYPATVTSYKPYEGQIYPITFPTEAGTVYGGTLDATTGVLTVEWVSADIASLSWGGTPSNYIYTSDYPTGLGKAIGTINVYTDCYKTINVASVSQMTNYSIKGNEGNTNLYVKDDRYSTVSEWKTALSGHMLCYKLATPQTYQLNPTEVKTLLGINNIWADTGDTEVEYRADTTLYIDKKLTATKSIIAGVETEFKASKNYTTGQYLIVGDGLYKTTSNIASGATIAVGTNVVSTTVAEQLIALANS